MLSRRNLKTEISLGKRVRCFRPHYTRRVKKSHRLPHIFWFLLNSIREITDDHRDANVFQKLRFQNVFGPHEIEKPAFSIYLTFHVKTICNAKKICDDIRFTLSASRHLTEIRLGPTRYHTKKRVHRRIAWCRGSESSLKRGVPGGV